MKFIVIAITAVVALGFLGSTIALGVLYNKSQNEVSAIKAEIEAASSSTKEKCPPIKPEPAPLPLCKYVPGYGSELLTFRRLIKNYADEDITNLIPLFRSFNSTALNATSGKAELAQRIVDFKNLETMQLDLQNCISEPEMPSIFNEIKFAKIVKDITSTYDYITKNWVDTLPYENVRWLYGSYNNRCDDKDKFHDEKIGNIYNLFYIWVKISESRDAVLLPKMNGVDLFNFHVARKEYREHLEQFEKFVKLQDGLELYCSKTITIDNNVTPEISVFTEPIINRRTFLNEQANRDYSPT